MKETISKRKIQPSEWEKLISNETSDKELISKIYKQLMQLTTTNKKQPNLKIKALTIQISEEIQWPTDT